MCPICMEKMPSGEALQKHFDALHDEAFGTATTTTTNFDTSTLVGDCGIFHVCKSTDNVAISSMGSILFLDM